MQLAYYFGYLILDIHTHTYKNQNEKKNIWFEHFCCIHKIDIGEIQNSPIRSLF